MKMVIAVVQDEDSFELLEALTEKDFRVTKLATTGGFLRSGNTTLLIGVNKQQTEEVINVIKNICQKREEVVSPSSFNGDTGVYIQYPISVKVGGATVFVVDVDQFLRI